MVCGVTVRMAVLTLAGATAAGGVAGALYRRPPAPWVLLALAALVAAAVAVFLIRRRERAEGPGGSVSWSVPAEGQRPEEAAFTLVPGAGRTPATRRAREPEPVPVGQPEQSWESAGEPVAQVAEPEPVDEPVDPVTETWPVGEPVPGGESFYAEPPPAAVEEPAGRGGHGVLGEWPAPANAPATSWWIEDTHTAGSDDADAWWGPDPYAVDPDAVHPGPEVPDREETHSGSPRRA